jgi:hypothetical protein
LHEPVEFGYHSLREFYALDGFAASQRAHFVVQNGRLDLVELLEGETTVVLVGVALLVLTFGFAVSNGRLCRVENVLAAGFERLLGLGLRVA